MSFKKWGACVCTLFWLSAATAAAQSVGEHQQPPEVVLMEAGELKRKVERGEPVTIIDVRGGDAFVGSDGKIRGALRVRPRRLRARLNVSPLKEVSRDREVVTYCACPDDEASVRAAQVLQAAGFRRVRVLKGGWQAWLSVRGQVEARQ